MAAQRLISAMEMHVKPVLFITCLFAAAAMAQEPDPEHAQLEVTLSYWRLGSSGNIKADGMPVDLKSDLGIQQDQPTFSGKLVVAPARKHKILVEGTPFRISGDRDLSRGITYAGRTYTVNERVLSTADLNVLYAGYQFDAWSRPEGHLGLNVGGAWLNATGTIRGQNTGITGTKTETVGLPLAGIAARVFPVRRRLLVEINAEVKGMAFGDYGHYLQTSIAAGVGIRNVLVEGGYRFVDMDIHTTNGATGVTPQFSGPIVSVVFRVR
jgi:hypothetical protein